MHYSEVKAFFANRNANRKDIDRREDSVILTKEDQEYLLYEISGGCLTHYQGEEDVRNVDFSEEEIIVVERIKTHHANNHNSYIFHRALDSLSYKKPRMEVMDELCVRTEKLQVRRFLNCNGKWINICWPNEIDEQIGLPIKTIKTLEKFIEELKETNIFYYNDLSNCQETIKKQSKELTKAHTKIANNYRLMAITFPIIFILGIAIGLTL
jgi:FtsZ-binding cell division protein ZapB